MALSVFDLFKIGIGPSSSHTVGPMKAAALFAERLRNEGLLDAIARVEVRMYGSLGATGKGHGTDKAVMLGLEGLMPDTIDPDTIEPRLKHMRSVGQILLAGSHPLPFSEKNDLTFLRREALPYHSNGVKFVGFDAQGEVLTERRYFSVGGGFVVSQEEADSPTDGPAIVSDPTKVKYPFSSGDDLLGICAGTGLSIAQVMRANEQAWRADAEVDAGLDRIWEAMRACVQRGIRTEGRLPGNLLVKRRAAELHRTLSAQPERALCDQLTILDFVNVYAMAVNEENAAGGRVVTAPTNGAAGIIPAVMHYYLNFISGANQKGLRDFLLTAGAIGQLYKENASISGAEVGCQGEVGVACSMAAAGLFQSSPSRATRCPTTRTGRSSGAALHPRPRTTPSWSAAAGMAWPRRITWPRNTACATSPWSSAAGWAAATRRATPPSCAPTTCGTTPRTSTKRPCNCGKASRRTSTTTPCSASVA
jgi:L-serine dehydratase